VCIALLSTAQLMNSALKYSRLKGKLPEILAKDTASTIEVSSRVIVSTTV
jgi:hypothetical protein